MNILKAVFGLARLQNIEIRISEVLQYYNYNGSYITKLKHTRRTESNPLVCSNVYVIHRYKFVSAHCVIVRVTNCRYVMPMGTNFVNQWT